MNKILYECSKCGKTSINNRNEDELNGDKCKGSLIPLGYVGRRITKWNKKDERQDR